MVKMYFVAVVAPGEINQQVLEWKNFMKEHHGCVVALRSPAHITLIPPFWIDESLETGLEEGLIEFSREKDPVDIRLKDFSAFNPRVIYVSVSENPELQKLQEALLEFMREKKFPVKADERPFHPHISIALRDLHKKTFREAWIHFKDRKYEASWQAKGISLLRHNEKNWEVIFTSQFSNA